MNITSKIIPSLLKAIRENTKLNLVTRMEIHGDLANLINDGIITTRQQLQEYLAGRWPFSYESADQLLNNVTIQ